MAPAFFNPKGIIVLDARRSYEGSFLLVIGVEVYMIVSRKYIHEAKEFVTCLCVYKFINMG